MKTKHCSLIIFLLFTTIDAKVVRRVVHFHRFEACDISQGFPVIVNYIKFANPPSENVRVAVNFTLTRGLSPDPRIMATAVRCANKEALDTCMPFTTLKPIDTCSFLALPNMFWTGIVYAFHPPLLCPFKKGDYIATNATFDAELFKFFPIDNYYWRTNITFQELDEYYTMCSEMQILKIRI